MISDASTRNMILLGHLGKVSDVQFGCQTTASWALLGYPRIRGSFHKQTRHELNQEFEPLFNIQPKSTRSCCKKPKFFSIKRIVCLLPPLLSPPPHLHCKWISSVERASGSIASIIAAPEFDYSDECRSTCTTFAPTPTNQSGKRLLISFPANGAGNPFPAARGPASP